MQASEQCLAEEEGESEEDEWGSEGLNGVGAVSFPDGRKVEAFDSAGGLGGVPQLLNSARVKVPFGIAADSYRAERQGAIADEDSAAERHAWLQVCCGEEGTWHELFPVDRLRFAGGSGLNDEFREPGGNGRK